MAKRRPEFKLPSTEKPATPEWVYKSNAAAAAPDRGRLIVDRYATYAGGVSLLPIPLIDVIAIGSLQVKMIAELAAIHGVPFNNAVGKSLIAAMVGGVASTQLAYNVGGTLLRSVPVVGGIAATLAAPAFGYGVTWAIGRVFASHFESGGTLADFDVKKAHSDFQQELAAGR